MDSKILSEALLYRLDIFIELLLLLLQPGLTEEKVKLAGWVSEIQVLFLVFLSIQSGRKGALKFYECL